MLNPQKQATRAQMRGVLRRARTLIAAPHTWCQGSMTNHTENGIPQRCALQAIEDGLYLYDLATGEPAPSPRNRSRAYIVDQTADVLRATPTVRGDEENLDRVSIGEWNDESERQHSDVLRAFDEAISAVSE